MNLTRLKGPGWRYQCTKTPAAVPRIPIPAAGWLTSGDSVSSCTLVTPPTGISVTIDTSTANAPTITLAGGSHGYRYTIPVLISTNAGLKKQITFFITVLDHEGRDL